MCLVYGPFEICGIATLLSGLFWGAKVGANFGNA